MASDIKLEDEEVIVEGSALRVKSLDLMLDHPDRRRSSTPELRRALVHDSNDGLTINFNNDYPGGVTIQGSALQLTCLDLMLDHPARRRSPTPQTRRALIHDANDGLTINFNNDYPGGVTIQGPVTIPGLKELIALKEELLSLRSEVTRLRNLVENGGSR